MEINDKLNSFCTEVLRTYLEFPHEKHFNLLDYRCSDGNFLRRLTKRVPPEQVSLYGIEQNDYSANQAAEYFKKVCKSFYLDQSRISKEAFSVVVVDAEISNSLYEEVYENISAYQEPDYERLAKEKIAEAKALVGNQLDLSKEGFSKEQLAAQKKKADARLAKAIEHQKILFRRASREQERRLGTLRDDDFLLANAIERLIPGGLLIMLTPKELIDQKISIKLYNNFTDIKILRLEDHDDYYSYGRCIIIARKRIKRINDRDGGILLAETKFKHPEDIEPLTIQAKPLYKVPETKEDLVEYFRVGPLSPEEILESSHKSTLIKKFREDYDRSLSENDFVSPTPLHKGHIMLLLTSGNLNGYIGSGPDQHLVKGSAIKLKRRSTYTENGLTRMKEREYFDINIKYLDHNGDFHQIM